MKIEEHIRFWIDGAEHDLGTAEELFSAEKFDWCLFLGHLVLEKALKAHYVQDNENQMPPRIHNLVKLAEKTLLPLSEPQRCKSREWRRSETPKGDAVVYYCEPLATKEMGHVRLSRRVKNMANSVLF